MKQSQPPGLLLVLGPGPHSQQMLEHLPGAAPVGEHVEATEGASAVRAVTLPIVMPWAVPAAPQTSDAPPPLAQCANCGWWAELAPVHSAVDPRGGACCARCSWIRLPPTVGPIERAKERQRAKALRAWSATPEYDADYLLPPRRHSRRAPNGELLEGEVATSAPAHTLPQLGDTRAATAHETHSRAHALPLSPAPTPPTTAPARQSSSAQALCADAPGGLTPRPPLTPRDGRRGSGLRAAVQSFKEAAALEHAQQGARLQARLTAAGLRTPRRVIDGALAMCARAHVTAIRRTHPLPRPHRPPRRRPAPCDGSVAAPTPTPPTRLAARPP